MFYHDLCTAQFHSHPSLHKGQRRIGLAMSQNSDIVCESDCIILKFDIGLNSSAAETRVKSGDPNPISRGFDT